MALTPFSPINAPPNQRGFSHPRGGKGCVPTKSDGVGEAAEFFAEAFGFGFVAMLNRIFKQGIQPLDFLNRTCPS